MRVVGKQHQRRKASRTDGVALGYRLGRVTDSIQWIGNIAYLLRHFRHFSDTARVIGNGTVGIKRDDHAGH